MKLPRKIKAGASNYLVTIGETADAYLRTHAFNGETNHQLYAILLTSEHGKIKRRDTLWHEILHCATRMTNLDHAWGDNEEDYVERLETALLAIMLDNKTLLEYIKDPE